MVLQIEIIKKASNLSDMSVFSCCWNVDVSEIDYYEYQF